MGSHGRKHYTVDFKREAVGLNTQQGYFVAEAAQNKGQIRRNCIVCGRGIGGSGWNGIFYKKPRSSSRAIRDEVFVYPPGAAAVSADRALPGLADGRPTIPDHAMVAQVRRLHAASRRTYGQRRLCQALRAEGVLVGVGGAPEP